MSQIVLIRPGCTDFDEQQRIKGTLDLPLTRQGQEQVGRLTAELLRAELDLIFASPCEPARMTAEHLGAALGIPVKEVEGLSNVNLGLWQGLQVEEVRRKHPKVFKQWQESPGTICPPEGEAISDAIERIRKALEKPLRKKGNLAFVAAEPLASIISSIVRDVPLEHISRSGPPPCGTWEVLRDAAGKHLTGELLVTPDLATARTP